MFKYGDNGALFQTVSLERFIVLQSVVHMKNDRNSCVRNEKIQREKDVQTLAPFSPPHNLPIM